MNQPTYKKLLDNLFDGVYYVDKKRIITYWNKAAERITGYKKEEVLGSSCADNILRHINALGKLMCIDGCPLFQTLKDGELREALLFLHHKQGHRVAVHIRISPIKNEEGEIVGGIEVFTESSRSPDLLKQIESLQKESLIDPLTRMGNRRYAEMIFGTRLFEMRSYKVPFCVALLDIDDLKRVNDEYGHNIGDKLLRMVARSAKSALRDLDTIIRWGGDEMVLILANVSEKGLEVILDRIRGFIEQSFIMVEEQKISTTVSLGGTPIRAQDSLEKAVERADSLMYTCKRMGGNGFRIG